LIKINFKDDLLKAIEAGENIHSSVFKRLNISAYEINIEINAKSYCKNCNIELNEKHFIGLKKGFRECCSTSCTNLYKYGVTCVLNTSGSIEKQKKTCLERYGFENPSQSEIVKEKKKKTFLDRYCCENPSQIPEAKEKRKTTNLERYNKEFYSQTDDFKDKIKQTSIHKYGVQHFTQSEQYKETIKNIKHWSQFKILNFTDYNQEFIKNFVTNGKFNMFKATKYFNVSSTILHRRFDIPKSQTIAESEIHSLIAYSILNDRQIISPLEIDILSHKFKFGVEYNGLMWHSSGKPLANFPVSFDSNKHLDKIIKMQEKGYTLFHIFENEWLDLNKKNIWISKIKNKIQESQETQKININDCIIKEVKEIDEFLDLNDLEGNCEYDICVGTFYKEELIQICCLDINFDTYTIKRLSTKLNFSVDNKLIDFIEKDYKPKIILARANRRWDNEFASLGFKVLSYEEPKAFYFKPNTLILSEHKNKDDRVIFDAGYTIYIKERNENENNQILLLLFFGIRILQESEL
jgi:hypothetical protein